MGIILPGRENHESNKLYVYRALRKNIIDLNLKPGENISEHDITNAFSVSRTPVREALNKLVDESLVEIYPQRGTFVSLIRTSHVDEGKFVRLHLEKAVMRLACTEFREELFFEMESNLNQQEFCVKKRNYINMFDLDGQLHQAIFKGCGKELVWLAFQSICGDIDRIRTLKLITFSNDVWERILNEHKELVQAIKNKDAEAGERVITNHIMQIDADVITVQKENSSYFSG